MKKDEQAVHLTASEFLASGRNGLNQQIASARWQFILAIQRKVPAVFERLRDDVYPAFARATKPGDWRAGRSFLMGPSRSASDHQVTAILMEWARCFHLEGEAWILEGAWQTLSLWQKFPRCREALEVQGFRPHVCVSGLSGVHACTFCFDDEGWDPTLMSFLGWRARVRQRFATAIEQYRQQMRARTKELGGVPAVLRCSADHFDWLALYQCGEASLKSIVAGASYGDKTTISKGMHQAAKLARIHLRETIRQLKKDHRGLFSTDVRGVSIAP